METMDGMREEMFVDSRARPNACVATRAPLIFRRPPPGTKTFSPPALSVRVHFSLVAQFSSIDTPCSPRNRARRPRFTLSFVLGVLIQRHSSPRAFRPNMQTN